METKIALKQSKQLSDLGKRWRERHTDGARGNAGTRCPSAGTVASPPQVKITGGWLIVTVLVHVLEELPLVAISVSVNEPEVPVVTETV